MPSPSMSNAGRGLPPPSPGKRGSTGYPGSGPLAQDASIQIVTILHQNCVTFVREKATACDLAVKRFS